MQGEEEANVHLLQTVWCRYVGQAISQPTNIWSAVLSKLAAAQVLDQQQQEKRQQHQQAQHLPGYTAQLSAQHPAYLITKDLFQDQLHSLRPASYEDYVVSPSSINHDVLRAASLQGSQAPQKTAQQELAELLRVDAEPALDLQVNRQDIRDWTQPSAPAEPPKLQQPPASCDAHGTSLMSLSPSPSAELSQIMSWSQLNSPNKDQKQQQQQQQIMSWSQLNSPNKDQKQQQQQQQSHLAPDIVGSSPISPLGSAYPDTWWAQQGSRTGPQLDTIPSIGHSNATSNSYQESATNTTMLGMGQYALEAAAAAPAHVSAPKQEQHEPPQWLQALQMESARAVRPRHTSQQDFARPSDILKPPFHGSASHSAREDSGDLSTSTGTQIFLGRVSSLGAGMAGTRDALMPVGMSSPKSSLGSSLPSLPHSMAQVYQHEVE